MAETNPKEAIELVLLQAGCDEFMYGWKGETALVQFSVESRRYRIALKMPPKKQFELTPTTGRRRSSDVAIKEWQVAQREIWQALLETIRASFKFVRLGASTIEKEFMAYIILPDGEMVGDLAEQMIANAYTEQRKLSDVQER